MRKRWIAMVLAAFIVLCAAAVVAGCGGDGESPEEVSKRPESVTAYQAVEYTRPAANKWQKNNWMIVVKDGDPDGITREGKAKIWEVFYFSPRPEENSQMLVIYNRGNVWPNTPGRSRGGEEGLEAYRKGKPVDFRVDSGEAYTVSIRNGGGDYLEAHPDTRVSVTLRSRADYDAVDEAMPSNKYRWIWTVEYSQPGAVGESLEVLVDGMNGDFISKEAK